MRAKKKGAQVTRWNPPNLKDKIAVVTGTSRGVGRGIARVLGECGATVYVTGRSVRGGPAFGRGPGTIDDAADEVTARGGRGIAVRCDHTQDEEVKALFQRVEKEQGRLDILVNNAWGGYEGGLSPAYFWQAPLELWEKMFVAGLRAHLVASYFAIPLMLATRRAARPPRALIVSTVAWDHDRYIGSFYDISKHAIVRMMYGLGIELRPFNIAALAVAPASRAPSPCSSTTRPRNRTGRASRNLRGPTRPSTLAAPSSGWPPTDRSCASPDRPSASATWLASTASPTWMAAVSRPSR